VLLDGRGYKVPGFDKGNWIGPTVIDNVRPGMKVYDEEIFGPVLIIVRVDTFQEGLELINSNRFGNGTAIFTRSGNTARKF
jgi:malonate-semialdehyde dehydrogenase (acetylating)/methylmalonate-semialdehyde dehydrogenase